MPSPTPLALRAPYSLKALDIEEMNITLTWESVPYAEGYLVTVKERNSSDWREAAYTQSTTAQVTRLSAGTEYQFMVVAVNGGIMSEPGILTVRTSAATPTPAPTKKPVRAGGKVKFGHYPQTAAGGDDTEIEWLVLEVDTANRRALVISRYALDCRPYNSKNTNVTWETCSLRKWLNGTFLDEAFTAQERKGIVETKTDNSTKQGYSGWSIDGGNNTADRIFLLSYAQAWKYFESDRSRQCRPTEFAAARGAYKAGNGNCWWWLRSPGTSLSSARAVHDRGALDLSDVGDDNVAVRPALWVDMDSGLF